MKKNDYLCPKCKGHLNAGGYIIFSSKNKRNQKGLVLLNPDIGSYTHKHHPSYHIEKGEMIEFFCPICQADLKSSEKPNFAVINMIDHNNEQYQVLFARKAGEKSTYVVSNENIEMFGDDALDYEDLLEEDY